MYKGIKVFTIFFSFLLLNGCASSCGSTGDTNLNQSTNTVIVPKQATNANVPKNANTADMVDGLANKNVPNPTLDDSKVKVINPEKSKVEPPKKRLPDNSEMSVMSVGKTFVEKREFKSDPQLDKLERIIEGSNINFKVYLKSGKTYDLEDGKLKDYKKDSAATILKAVGVTPAKKSNTKENQAEVDEKLKKKSGS